MATSDLALERVQALLKIDTGSGSIHSHLVRVVQHLAEEQPADALAHLETLSRHLKQSSFRGDRAPDGGKAVNVDKAVQELRRLWCVNAPLLVRSPNDSTLTATVLPSVQNLMEDAAMFEWAGVGFGKQEAFHIMMSLRKLAVESPSVQNLRLWGKILGTEEDYYIAEGLLAPRGAPREGTPPPPPKPPILPGTMEYDVEPTGQGANTAVYWVSHGSTSSWVRLPSVRASQIEAARKIQRHFTGNLSSPIISTPWFKGEERHLVRAQIARINSTCTLAPKGWYEEDAEAEVKNTIKISEDPIAGFPKEEIDTQAGWTHCAPYLLGTGRTTWPDLDAIGAADPPLMSDAELGNLTEEQGKDPEKPMLEPIESDLAERKAEDSSETFSIAWSVKTHGDDGLYSSNDDTVRNRVVSVRSLIWPGAVTVSQGTKYANIYVGDGLKCGRLVPADRDSGLPLPLNGTNPFFPLVPADIMDEPKDFEEYPEPNPQEVEKGSEAGSVEAEDE